MCTYLTISIGDLISIYIDIEAASALSIRTGAKTHRKLLLLLFLFQHAHIHKYLCRTLKVKKFPFSSPASDFKILLD